MKLLTHFQDHYEALRECRTGKDEYWIDLVRKGSSQCSSTNPSCSWVGDEGQCVNPQMELHVIREENIQGLSKRKSCQAITIKFSNKTESDEGVGENCKIK